MAATYIWYGSLTVSAFVVILLIINTFLYLTGRDYLGSGGIYEEDEAWVGFLLLGVPLLNLVMIAALLLCVVGVALSQCGRALRQWNIKRRRRKKLCT